jgi:hypothetical protein
MISKILIKKGMTKLIVILLFVFPSVSNFGQHIYKDSTLVHPNLVVKLNASGFTDNANIELDKEFLLFLSESKSLLKLEYTTRKDIHDLKAELLFKDMNSLFDWYEEEETKYLLKLIRDKFKNHSIAISLDRKVVKE